MKAKLVPDRRTRLTIDQVIPAFRDAYNEVIRQSGVSAGATLDAPTLALMIAQSSLECGAWKSIHCFNFGNIKASSYYRGLYCRFRCNEVINGKIEWFDPPHPQTNFRAYETAEAGALDYMRFLAVDTNGDGYNRYAKVWRAIVEADGDDADVFTFVRELKRAGYFTASESLYYDGGNGSGGVLALYRQYLPHVQSVMGAARPNPGAAPDLDDLNARITALENWRERIANESAAA
jgi:hypothetical protein